VPMGEHSYDLVVVGAGTGNMLPDSVVAGRRIAVVEAGLFGGTCLNRGCIPSKILVYTADVAQTIRDAAAFGIDASPGKVDWPAIRDRVFGHIDTVPGKALDYRRRSGVDVYTGQARFTGPKELRVGEDTLRASNIVLATGSRPKIPDLPGLADVPYLTSDNVMRLPELPGSMAILGGGFIAAEMGHVFGSLGSKITVIERGPALLSRHDTDIAVAFTSAFGQQVDLRLNTTVQRVDATAGGVRLSLLTPDGPAEVTAAKLLVATGRRPNSDLLDLPAAGISTDEHGHVQTDHRLQTKVPGVWALGDLANHFQLKHMANAEARVVWHNIVHPDQPREARFPVVPAAVFSDPQIAAAGATEQELITSGRPYLAATRRYGSTAYGWALQDTTGFVKVLADPETRLLLGAHLIGPQASILIQPLVQAMCLGSTIDDVATGVLYIHPALTEVVEQALLGLGVEDDMAMPVHIKAAED
jgi:mycothione reductase